MGESLQSGLLGRIGLHYRMITADQLAEATRVQGLPGNEGRRLGEILVELGYVSTGQLGKMLELQQIHLKRMTGGKKRSSVSGPRAGAVITSPPRRSTGAERNLDKLLALAMKLGASDVHLHAGSPVQMRVAGRLSPLKMPPLEGDACQRIVFEALDEDERMAVLERGDLDLAYALAGVGRFRASVYRERRGVHAVFRPIAPEPPTLERLGLPRTLARLATFHQGLVLIAGPTGSGKSSTLAAMVNLVNEERHDHIVTIEDPIEFIHPSKACVVNQRQVARHTESFATALRAALREDPDVIAIGELRDLETVSLAITAAETGHLVLATLHTGSVVRTISRVIDVFPPAQQSQVRAMVSESLRAVVCQRLVPTADGRGRVPAVEVLFNTPAIAHLVREEKLHQIRSAMQTGRSMGMCLLDDSLAELARAGLIARDAARRFADDPKLFA
jgi:twitching motility protein PilT